MDRDGPLNISMSPVPKMLAWVVSRWIPKGFVITFKLETLESLLMSKAQRALDLYGHHVVVANLLHTRKEVVYLVTGHSHQEIRISPEERGLGLEIEAKLIDTISEKHQQFMLSSDL